MGVRFRGFAAGWVKALRREYPHPRVREFFIDNLLVRIHSIVGMIRWTSLAPWEFEFLFPGSLTSTFLPLHPGARLPVVGVRVWVSGFMDGRWMLYGGEGGGSRVSGGKAGFAES